MNLTNDEKRFLHQNEKILKSLFEKRRMDLVEEAASMNPIQSAPVHQSMLLEQAKEYSHIWPTLIEQSKQGEEQFDSHSDV